MPNACHREHYPAFTDTMKWWVYAPPGHGPGVTRVVFPNDVADPNGPAYRTFPDYADALEWLRDALDFGVALADEIRESDSAAFRRALRCTRGFARGFDYDSARWGSA